MKLGHGTLDGTKIKANASNHNAESSTRMALQTRRDPRPKRPPATSRPNAQRNFTDPDSRQGRLCAGLSRPGCGGCDSADHVARGLINLAADAPSLIALTDAITDTMGTKPKALFPRRRLLLAGRSRRALSAQARRQYLDRARQTFNRPHALRTADQVSGTPHEPGEIIAERDRDVSLSDTVLFPFTPAQRNSLEDLRLLRFDEAGEPCFLFGTDTANSGSAIASEIMDTRDFRTFSLRPLTRKAAHDKALALFPRKIDGAFAMIGRHDHERLFLLRSHDLHNWEPGEFLLGPQHHWDLVEMGDCGPPIEIEEGWLV